MWLLFFSFNESFLASAATDHGTYGVIRSKILRALHGEQRAEFRAGAVNATLDGADCASADCSCIFIRKA